ncbi:MAG: HGGxSTG domain-containing protein [Dongiaceae bacterium]
MAGLTARLMEGVQRLLPQVRVVAAPPAAWEAVSHPAPATPEPDPAAVRKRHAAPGQRRGCLKNGNPSGDYLQAPRCGARTRAGCPCRQPAMANRRCRLHGGLSTGPRTPEGLARSRTARLTHGYRTRALIGLRSRAAHTARRLRNLNRALSAGHGVHRSNSAFPSGGTAPSGRPPSATAAPTPGAHPGGTLRKTALGASPAGHGVHRSFRERLRSATAL